MAVSPPSLTISPFSTSNTYCSSDRSSPDYSSPPELADQHYKLASLYGSDLRCTMTPPMDSEPSLPPFDVSCQAGWAGETGIHPSSSTTAMPSILSTEYDTYSSYESSLPPYGHDLYQTQLQPHPNLVHDSTPPPTGSISGSPMPSSRVYAANPTMAGPSTPRIKVEGAEKYTQGTEMSHYPSPRSVQTGFCADNGYSSPGTGYLSDSQSSWQTSDYQGTLEPDQYYAGSAAASAAGSPSPFMQDARRSYRATRPRRAPRRLTTREEANFQCEIKGCGKLFSRSYNYKAHMETHDEKREYPFPCMETDCAKKFVRKTDLQRHHQSVHMKERNHKCDFCSRMFARKDTLRRHMEDGCSKRFDIGTLDFQSDSYSGQMGFLMPSHGGLPPMSMPPLGSSNVLGSAPPMRGMDQGQGQWGR